MSAVLRKHRRWRIANGWNAVIHTFLTHKTDPFVDYQSTLTTFCDKADVTHRM